MSSAHPARPEAESATAAAVGGAPRALPATPERLPLRTILDFVAPTAGLGFMFLLMGIYLMIFATDVLLISPAVMGTIVAAGRVWDAVSDPAAGFLSDRTRTRMGRRRPWLLGALLPLCAIYVFLWSPPRGLEGAALTAWMAFGVLGFYTAMTLFVVPHFAFAAELTTSYHDRTRIFGLRHIVWSLGSLLALVGMWFLIEAADARTTAFRVSLSAAVVTGLLSLWMIARVPERAEYQGRGGENPLRAYRDVLRNPHARLLLGVFLIENFGSATIGILTPYVARYIIGRPDLTVFFILTYMVATIAFVPIWPRLAPRFGKKQLWIVSMLLTAGAFGGMIFLGEGDVVLLSSLAFLGGFAGSCGATVGPSIQADVIDYDEFRTGERKEGAYFAAWNFVFKSSAGVTLLLTGFVLELTGYVPNAQQTESARFAILVLYSLFPLACYLIGTAWVTRFSLDEAAHARIRAELDARRAAAGPGDGGAVRPPDRARGSALRAP